MKTRVVIRSHVDGAREVQRERRHQRRYAKRHGYFWLPCPLCGVQFGGHEPHGTIPVDGSEERSEIICGICTAERQEAAESYLRYLGESEMHSTTRWGFKLCLQHRVGKNPAGRTTDGLIVEVPS